MRCAEVLLLDVERDLRPFVDCVNTHTVWTPMQCAEVLLLDVERDLRPFVDWLEHDLGIDDPKNRAELVAR